jgi:hypothetical protein
MVYVNCCELEGRGVTNGSGPPRLYKMFLVQPLYIATLSYAQVCYIWCDRERSGCGESQLTYYGIVGIHQSTLRLLVFLVLCCLG